MRLIAVIGLAGAAVCFAAQAAPESYSALLKEDGHTWCVYKDPAEFKSDAAALKPTESARVDYQSGDLVDLTYQVEPESGDWIVVDKYTPSKGEILLRRANLLAQKNLEIIQEATIHGGKVGDLHVVSVTTLDGKKAKLSNVDFPAVPVKTNLSTLPFVQLIAELQSQSAGELCK